MRPTLAQWRAAKSAPQIKSPQRPTLSQWREQRAAQSQQSTSPAESPKPQRDGARAELERLLAAREQRLDKQLRERLTALAGSDPVRRSRALDLIESLRTQPATTRPAAPEGKVATNRAVVSEWERLRKIAPHRAASYYLEHADEIDAARGVGGSR